MADAAGPLPPGYRSSPKSPFGELAPEDEPAARRAVGSSLPVVDRARMPGAEGSSGQDAPATASAEPVPDAAALAEHAIGTHRWSAPEPAEGEEPGAAEPAAAAGPGAQAARRQVRGRRLPQLVRDGDGYMLPALAGRYRLDDALFQEAVPGEPVLTFQPPSAPPRVDSPPGACFGLRATVLVGIAVILVLAAAPAPIMRPFGFLFAIPPLLAAIVVATIGLVRRQKTAAGGALALALLALAVDVVLIIQTVA
ncbi:hypothetical protein USB125703_01027 [Pseudoclavibacter triregionum]|nr:hypothetical protein USB125703_01027 [Pseudoclavibacter triregionum]